MAKIVTIVVLVVPHVTRMSAGDGVGFAEVLRVVAFKRQRFPRKIITLRMLFEATAPSPDTVALTALQQQVAQLQAGTAQRVCRVPVAGKGSRRPFTENLSVQLTTKRDMRAGHHSRIYSPEMGTGTSPRASSCWPQLESFGSMAWVRTESLRASGSLAGYGVFG